MNTVHVVTGAGPVGSTVALQLADAGHQVRLLTRSGSGPVHPLIDRRRVDVSRPESLAEAFDGAVAVHHCIHGSAYDAKVWRAELPQAEAAVLAAAGRVGAVVVFPESLYSYGRVDGPMTEATPRDGDHREARRPHRAAGPARRVHHADRLGRGLGLLRAARAHLPRG